MKRWSRRAMLAAGLVAAVSACGPVDRVTAPEAARFDSGQTVLSDTLAMPPVDAAAADSSGGRWGGFLGGGN